MINHLKHVFSDPRDAELVCWHSEKCRENDEGIRHLVNGIQWIFLSLVSKICSGE
jgi:hypothetical protein